MLIKKIIDNNLNLHLKKIIFRTLLLYRPSVKVKKKVVGCAKNKVVGVLRPPAHPSNSCENLLV